MEADKVAIIGFYIRAEILFQGKEKIKAHIYNKTNIHGRVLLMLGDYLKKYSNKFNRVRYLMTDELNIRYPNGTLSGIIAKVNQSEIDIGVEPFSMNEVSTEIVDFAFPYRLYAATFVTRTEEYKPQTFGIF